ncbi:hypothetical protein O6H91_11G117800 [Diphasiastrum complanatum]|uniref:Uncharacterized protein n=2 Tax=Diphasiastrum complanatum TaxID=34168 RepID=A0ACC2CD73_DIPCM|nr:hypothetical protein O6H91_Y316000 [Diphasiastrum complanatum]KAJ7539997.1 hypothetical protein O6H91_11G117800 [Diphasiastrum complanatum]KAJ7539998.1 hypothetical protein O6H91_11G117800 [Diphasiastrum complanatum]
MSSLLQNTEGTEHANSESHSLQDETAGYDVPSGNESKSLITFAHKRDEMDNLADKFDEREAILEHATISASDAVMDSQRKSEATSLASSSSIKRSFERKRLVIVPQRSSWPDYIDADCKDFASSVDEQPRTSVSDEYEVVPLAVPSSPMLCNKTDDFDKKIQTQLKLASVKLSYIAVEM